MATVTTTKKLRISGMTCVNCQNKIEKKLAGSAGIERAKVSWSDGTAVVTYHAEIISLDDIIAIIRKLGYEALEANRQEPPLNAGRIVGVILIIAALYFIAQRLGLEQIFNGFQTAEAGMGYGMIFIIGLVTSVHCLAMCGGINISQCMCVSGEPGGRLAPLRQTFLYNIGRVISYTAIGGIVGALGSVISFSGALRGVVQLVAGIFMVVMGMNMLGVFPWLRRFTPRMPRVFANKIDAEKGRSNSPLYIGLLNGLMPCGPLQAMQIYALSTGSAAAGALSMLLFSLGTLPLMFGLGALSSILTKKFTHKIMTSGAVLVVVLGLSMFMQGWSLSGFSGVAFASAPGGSESGSGIEVKDGVQVVNSTLSGRRYPAITVQAGVPVRWIIDAPQGSINGCNNRMIIPEYGIEHAFAQGENIIEFTPEKTGKFQYSCWMGMIRSTITVTEDGAGAGTTTTEDETAGLPYQESVACACCGYM